MPFKDYTEFVEPLRLPYQGVEYEIPPLGIQTGLTLTQALDPGSSATLTDEEFQALLLGSAFEQMRADDVPPGFVLRCALTALAEFQAGRSAAEGVWEAGADPKAIEQWVGSRTNAESAPSTSTAAATTTPSPGRGSGTTSRKAKPAA